MAIRQGHIEHIKQMLDERQNPQCPQCKNPAQFIAEERGVYLRCSNSGRAESIKEMVSERSEWDDALEEMAEPLRVQHLGSILPLGERWVAWATAASAAEKVHIDTELESFTMNSDEHLEIMERRSHGRADKDLKSIFSYSLKGEPAWVIFARVNLYLLSKLSFSCLSYPGQRCQRSYAQLMDNLRG